MPESADNFDNFEYTLVSRLKFIQFSCNVFSSVYLRYIQVGMKYARLTLKYTSMTWLS